jgi:alanyl-tRNA synthetase
VCGDVALAWVAAQQAALADVMECVKAQPHEVVHKVRHSVERVRQLEKEVARLKAKLAALQGDDLAASAIDVKGIKALTATLEGADLPTLRETLDKLKDKLKSAAIVLAAVSDGKVSLIAGVTPDLTARLKAGELVNFVAQQVGGKGGGRPDMAQAGGAQPENLPAALASVPAWIESKLAA